MHQATKKNFLSPALSCWFQTRDENSINADMCALRIINIVTSDMRWKMQKNKIKKHMKIYNKMLIKINECRMNSQNWHFNIFFYYCCSSACAKLIFIASEIEFIINRMPQDYFPVKKHSNINLAICEHIHKDML
jgi:hypothetical protein